MATMNASDAVAALAGIDGYEETLTARASGVTGMIWAMVSAGIFLTYGTAGPVAPDWLFSILWMPWVAAGWGVTAALWSAQQLTLGQTEAQGSPLGWLAGAIVFIAIAAAMYFTVMVVFDVDWNMHAIMTLANGGFAGVLGLRMWSKCYCGGPQTVVAGAAMVTLGVGLGFAGMSNGVTALVAAAGVAVCWGAAALWTYLRG